MSTDFEEKYFEDPTFPPGLKGGDEVRGYGYYPDYFPIVEAQLSSLIELTSGVSLLDVGCGKGALAAYARADLGVSIVGTDASAYAVRHAHRRLGPSAVVRADCARLPFAPASFDLVWCNGVLQYQEAAHARSALASIAACARHAAFVSNIAAAQRLTDWGRHDRLTRLYLRPAQWATLAQAETSAQGASQASDWRVTALPFEGESAILFHRASLGPAFAPRFVELALERMRRLGALTRSPPGLDAFYRRLAR